MIIADAKAPRIVSDPSSMNASINSQVSFTCTAENTFSILWEFNMSVKIDALQLEHELEVQSNGSQLTYIIDMEINEDQDIGLLNNSNITCRGFNLLDDGVLVMSNYSYPPARLLIQGKWKRIGFV